MKAVNISTTQYGVFHIDHYSSMSKERWEGILQCKKDFFAHKIKDPGESPFISPEVAESWVRCHKAGLNPHKIMLGKELNAKEVEQSKKTNSLVIEALDPLLRKFNLTEKYPHFLTIDDNNGVPLYRQNENYPKDTRKLFGKMFEETITGTNAHTLCKRLKRAVQLQGPEHYFDSLEEFVVTAAPILDINGDVSAILVLSQPLVSPPWDSNFQAICYHTFALVSAMAAAIENGIQLEKSYNDLKKANNLISNTLAAIDEGIVTIDQSGKIMNLNEEGRQILKVKVSDEENKKVEILNINEFLPKESHLMQSVLSGKNEDLEEILCVGNNKQPYLIKCHPILKQGENKVEGAVLRLLLMEKVNNQATVRTGSKASFTFSDLVGDNKGFKKTIALGESFSKSSENILLIGESGTGKELFAQAIHNSSESNGPFIAVNCAAMPRQLIESELFGYEGGSFTGADRNGRPGKIELAHGGTLFLDEIGDMPYELQAVLLRVVQDKQVMRIGGQSYKKVNFRLVAATNKNLLNMVETSLFREDLYYRLSVLSINIPTLRERASDIEILASYFVNNYCKKMKINTPRIVPEAQSILNNYSWPGNVRQLENTMTYAMIIAGGGDIKAEHLPASLYTLPKERTVQASAEKDRSRQSAHSLRDSEKLTIEEAIINANKNLPQAAKQLGISKSTLYRKLREYNLEGY